MSRIGEFDWISKYLAPLASKDSFGLRDDAALLSVPTGCELVVTQDAIAETVHFLNSDPLETVAQKALRVNISDIVAKGAKPFAYSMALGMPDVWGEREMEQFANGLAKDQAEFGLTLTGGDTYRSPAGLCVSITMFGTVENGRYKSRLGARSGDILAVSGTIGNAAIGLKVATDQFSVAPEAHSFFVDCYRIPSPPVTLGPTIAEYATASMDISDGLLGDAAKLCRASGVTAQINRLDIPIDSQVRNLLNSDPELLRSVLTGGDDYQVLCTVSPENWEEFHQAASTADVQIRSIGQLTDAESEPVSLDMQGLEVSLGPDSYSHF